MSLTVKDVLQMIKDHDVKFVDLRFTDTRGKEQHVSVPAKYVGEDKFEEGHAFDGSSIAGWKGIQASDMLLMPDPATAYLDPFMDENTLILTCDVVEPTDGKGYDRDPRSIAKRAEAYLQSSGAGDTAYFGPEPEFFVFDSVNWQIDMSGCFVKINSRPGPRGPAAPGLPPARARTWRHGPARWRWPATGARPRRPPTARPSRPGRK